MKRLLTSTLCSILIASTFHIEAMQKPVNTQLKNLPKAVKSLLEAPLKNLHKGANPTSIQVSVKTINDLRGGFTNTNSKEAIKQLTSIVNNSPCHSHAVSTVIRLLLMPADLSFQAKKSSNLNNESLIDLSRESITRASGSQCLIHTASRPVMEALAKSTIPSKFGSQTILHMASLFDLMNGEAGNIASEVIGKTLINALPTDQRIPLLKSRNALGSTPLHYAALLSEANFFTALLDGVSKIDKVALLSQANILGSTPVHYAALNIKTPGIMSSMFADLSGDDKLSLLTAKNMSNTMPLHLATLLNHPAVIDYALFQELQQGKAGLSLSTALISKNNDDVTVLDCAIIAMLVSQMPVATILSALAPKDQALFLSLATSFNATLGLTIKTAMDITNRNQRCEVAQPVELITPDMQEVDDQELLVNVSVNLNESANMSLISTLIDAASRSPFISKNTEELIVKVANIFKMASCIMPDLGYALYQTSNAANFFPEM